jgi:hypothetical protein
LDLVMSGLTWWTQLDLVGRSDAEKDAVGQNWTWF